MSDEISEFLRRAAQRRSQPPPDLEILDAEVVDAEILEDISVSGSHVSQGVSEHLDTSSFDERVSHLGEDVDRSDDRMETHLHDVFEHRLGRLGTQTSKTEDSVLDSDDSPQPETPSSTSAGGLADMLRSPRSLRNAIIVREILTRPEHLW